MTIKNKRVLVTGATGFIGANILRAILKQGSKASIITRSQSDVWRIKDVLKDVRNYKADLLDGDRLRSIISRIKPEVILHTVTYGGRSFQRGRKKIFDANFNATVNLLDACNRKGFEVFVNTGSSSEYGIKDIAMREDALPEPVTDYGVSKAAATLWCQAFARRERAVVVTLRLFSPYGYFDNAERLIPYVIVSCIKGKVPKIVSKSSVRDFIFSDDVIAAYLKAVQKKSDIGGEIFNIGCGRQISVKKIVEKIIRFTGNKAGYKCACKDEKRIEPKRWVADISKARKILGWEPRIGVSEGLGKTTEWFRQNLSFYRVAKDMR